MALCADTAHVNLGKLSWLIPIGDSIIRCIYHYLPDKTSSQMELFIYIFRHDCGNLR